MVRMLIFKIIDNCEHFFICKTLLVGEKGRRAYLLALFYLPIIIKLDILRNGGSGKKSIFYP